LFDGQVEADADYCPAVLGLRLYQDAGQLAAFDPDVVGPLDLALDAGCELLGCLADGEGNGEGEEQVALVQGAEDRGVEERLAGGCGPGAALAAAAGGLLVGGDDGSVWRSGLDQLASAGVGRVGDAVMPVGRPEAHPLPHHGLL